MITKKMIALWATATLLMASAAVAMDRSIALKREGFSPMTLVLKRGDTVTFKNEDTVYHHIYSMSGVQPFDLGPFSPAETATVKFNAAGLVTVQCSVHRGEEMTISVK